MDLVVLDVDTERPDGRGRRRVFLRVGAWWDGGQPPTPPDATLDFLLAEQPAVRRFDNVAPFHRRTVSGRVLPATTTHVEVNGEWVPMAGDGPPGDPWLVITTPAPDPLADLWPIVHNVALARKAEGFRGADTFDPGEVRVDAAHRQTATGRALRAVVGRRRTSPVAP